MHCCPTNAQRTSAQRDPQATGPAPRHQHALARRTPVTPPKTPPPHTLAPSAHRAPAAAPESVAPHQHRVAPGTGRSAKAPESIAPHEHRRAPRTLPPPLPPSALRRPSASYGSHPQPTCAVHSASTHHVVEMCIGGSERSFFKMPWIAPQKSNICTSPSPEHVVHHTETPTPFRRSRGQRLILSRGPERAACTHALRQSPQ